MVEVVILKMAKWECTACGYVYDEEKGDQDSGIAPGTKWEDIPNDWVCPVCGIAKSDTSVWVKQG